MVKRGRDEVVEIDTPTTSDSSTKQDRVHKRIRLDDLFDSLHIGGDNVPRGGRLLTNNIHENDNDVDLEDENEADEELFIPNYTYPSKFDMFLQSKINRQFNEEMESDFQLIIWYDPRWVMIYHFQRWVVRLFNRFVARYNKHNGTAIPRVRRYDKILRLVETRQLTPGEMENIINNETQLELQELARKDARRLKKSAKLEELQDTSYNYWDRGGVFDRDIDMSSDSSF